MTQCLIVDDEPLAQQVLEQHISRTEGLSLAGKCNNAIAAFEFLHRQTIDLLFLDIKMPLLTGTDFIRSLKNPPAFIFTTAFSEYAMQGYELHAEDYLLKPVTYERFKRSVDRFLRRMPVTAPGPVLVEKDYLYIKVDGSLVKIFYREILFAQSMKDYIRVYTKTGNYITHMTMKSLVDLLPELQFRRIHRSYIINSTHIGVIGKDSVTIDGTVLTIGENYKMNLKGLL